jgi:uncharacterized iron-regulated protein
MRTTLFAAILASSPVYAGELDSFKAADFEGADVIIIGEVHDNAEHHQLQAEIITFLEPAAVVFEMLNAEQAGLITPQKLTDPELGKILGWEDAGWPDFAIYAPVFAASQRALVYGATPPIVAAMQARNDIADAFGDAADQFGLTTALSQTEQNEREAGMQDSHCGALPPEILPWFVDQQRFRDATFARETLNALAQSGGPVVVITGNGHARTDWGMPVYLAAAAPDVVVMSVGQITTDQVDAPFDLWRVTSSVPRPDPCAAFE